MAQMPRALQFFHVSAAWLLCAWCGSRHSEYIVSSNPSGSSMKIPVYRGEMVLLGSPNMALPSSRNVLGKGTVWTEAMRHHGLLGSLHMSTWLVRFKRTACGKTRPGLCSLLSQSMEADLLVLTPPSQCTCPHAPAMITKPSCLPLGLHLELAQGDQQFHER